MARARLNRVKRDFENDVRFHLAISTVIDDRVFFEILGQFRDLNVGQSAVSFANGQEFTARFIADRKSIIAQHVVAFAVAKFSADDHHIEGGQFFL